MRRVIFICVLSCLMPVARVFAQSSIQPTTSSYTYRHPASDKISWQRLNLLLSATYFRVVQEGEIDFDSCLLYASQSLGLSRLPLLSEGIDDRELMEQAGWVDRNDPAEGIRLLSRTTGEKRVKVLLLLGAYYAFQPRSVYRRDSVEYFLFKAMDEASRLNEKRLERQARCLHGKMLFEINEFARGDSVLASVINECEREGDKESEARAWLYRALFPDYSPATSKNRITWFQKAASLYHELNDPEGEINALTDAGYMMVTIFDLQNAYASFQNALQLAEDIHYPYIHYNTDALAMVTMFDGKFGEPLKYTLQTINVAEKKRDSIGWAYFYSRLGDLYQIEGNKGDEAVKWYLKSLDRFLISEDPALYLALYNVAEEMVGEGKVKEALDLVSNAAEKVPPVHSKDRIYYNLGLARCYRGLRQYDAAERYTLEADRVLKESFTLRNAEQRAMIDVSLGHIYFQRKNFIDSKKHFQYYLAAPSFSKLLINQLYAYRRLIEIDSVFDDVVSAVNHYKVYNQLLDSNFRISKLRQAEELQVMYQIEEKESEITLLNEQAKLRQANLDQAKLTKNVTIAGIVAVMVIAILLYRQNRLKQKNNVIVTHKNAQLQHLLNEKEWLLKEIHHRVKNNLQIVMSLLNSQSAYIDSIPARTAIHDSQHRVQAMSLIHQKLYSTDNVSTIEMSTYIRELSSYLSDSFNIGQRIRFLFDIEPLELDVGQAVPLGLILNEAITNSIKYAFPGVENPVVTISLKRMDSAHCQLSISDNGIGIPPHLQNRKPGSLGMSLIEGLSEDLEGKLTIGNDKGTTVKIFFPHHQAIHQTKMAPVPI